MLFLKKYQASLIALIAFGVLIMASYRYTVYKKGQWEKDVRNDLLEVLIGKKSTLEKALYSRIYYTRGVAGFVSLKPDITNEEYARLAAEFIKDDTVINSMALSRGGVINAIYPYEGHEEAIGLDLLAHPERREIVEKTIQTRKTFVAGPVELVEGGIAFISYTPIFDQTKDTSSFWGICDIVILRDRLFQEAGIIKTENNINYALRGYNGTGWEGAIFWGMENVFQDSPVTINIELPDGKWILAASPVKGWSSFLDQDRVVGVFLFSFTIITSILIWLLARAIIRLKTSERNLRAMTMSLQESNSMKDKLFSIIAHDLKNPAGTFKVLSELLVDEYSVMRSEKRLVILKSMKQSANSLYTMLRNLLEWSRAQQQSISINRIHDKIKPLVDEVIKTIEMTAEIKQLAIKNEVAEDITAFFDPEITKTILRNLISNAVKYTAKEGNIFIRADKTTIENESFVVFEIQDTGLGISDEEIKQIFDTKNMISTPGTEDEQGTGIGLIICKEFIEKQGGKLSVSSETGKGSTFRFTIPREE